MGGEPAPQKLSCPSAHVQPFPTNSSELKNCNFELGEMAPFMEGGGVGIPGGK